MVIFYVQPSIFYDGAIAVKEIFPIGGEKRSTKSVI